MPEEIQISVQASPTESVSTLPCAICRRQFSRYTCPQCNIPYCSLTCFRSESHSNCSETFYQKELESDVRSAPSASEEEKRKMMELLKQFEQESTDDDLLIPDADEEEDTGDELAYRLGGMDLDSASYDDIWAALTPAERDKFMRALQDPNSELTQQLLASEELEKERIEPWWETPTGMDADAEDQIPSDASKKAELHRRYGTKPPVMQVPSSMLNTPSVPGKSPMLLYNICAVCITYAYITRSLATSPLSSVSPSNPEYEEARATVSRLLPFLADRKSTMVYPSLSNVVTDIWSRFEPGTMTPPFFSILLRDAVVLLLPSSVTVVSTASSLEGSSPDLSSHPSAKVLRVFSDLSYLLAHHRPTQQPQTTANTNGGMEKPKPSHVAHKLTFYAAHVVGVPPLLLRALVDELRVCATGMEREETVVKGASHELRGERPVGAAPPKARIEEIS
ncbi:hypothetical protein WOLCODRAFT_133088 [Wolfiporia cocos MD-104 SS10]|uniref:HIT-type domain-containing protein n=1 Tax=Wolfiporia cocos (strain MD-104) TaxID=742152 RepID=A0A2H3K6P1_WOLCO|nr:hypothetical protein WOLCODRAFT_133088 [Wolfiporia cocos MD-104 SS10]